MYNNDNVKKFPRIIYLRKVLYLQIDQATEYPLSRKRLFVNMFEMFLYDDDQFTIGIFRMIQTFAREKGYTLNRRHLIIDIVEMLYFELELLEVTNFFELMIRVRQ